ncbi:hypothetical protein [Mesorhizobium erdmanii]|uniref:Uncharacterized protein n=1 Tax=Mesorhizobium erdmanii TaxID=1777866 RepID=A0A6M7UKZ7_9HYPH|nr:MULTISPECIES: hypothetical protein [Mesorhizobium]OBQ75335.1 hypothetical protein A8146_06525 [Mesorhizobium loti]QKC77492.1 hypothetical protein EB233_19940 [Mesorhizobium erdmanii]
MQDHELVERPGRGWAPWKHDSDGDTHIEKVWWAARPLHFAKLNVSCWFDGSDLVGIVHWGYRGEKWCVKLKPKDWQPLPEEYRLERERLQQEALARHRAESAERFLAATASRQDAQAIVSPLTNP